MDIYNLLLLLATIYIIISEAHLSITDKYVLLLLWFHFDCDGPMITDVKDVYLRSCVVWIRMGWGKLLLSMLLTLLVDSGLCWGFGIRCHFVGLLVGCFILLSFSLSWTTGYVQMITCLVVINWQGSKKDRYSDIAIELWMRY